MAPGADTPPAGPLPDLAEAVADAGAAPDEVEDEAEGGGRERRCIVTRQALPVEGLIRFVVGPDGTVVPDIEGRLPGRGFWVSADREVLTRAVERGLLARAASRAAGGPVRMPPDLVAWIDRLLTARCLNLVGLARRAGQAVAGFEKVREWLRDSRAGLLIEAADGGADGRSKLMQVAAATGRGGLPVVDLFEAAALGAALGRDIVVHGALAPGRLAGLLAEETERLRGVRGAVKGGSGGKSVPAAKVGTA